MTDKNAGLELTADRLVMWAVAALLAFNTFQKETVTADHDLKLQMARFGAEQARQGQSLQRLEAFSQAPRFTSGTFASEMVPRDGATARLEEEVGRISTRQQVVEKDVASKSREIQELKFLIEQSRKD